MSDGAASSAGPGGGEEAGGCRDDSLRFLEFDAEEVVLVRSVVDLVRAWLRGVDSSSGLKSSSPPDT
jgi:hypothetical protein